MNSIIINYVFREFRNLNRDFFLEQENCSKLKIVLDERIKELTAEKLRLEALLDKKNSLYDSIFFSPEAYSVFLHIAVLSITAIGTLLVLSYFLDQNLIYSGYKAVSDTVTSVCVKAKYVLTGGALSDSQKLDQLTDLCNGIHEKMIEDNLSALEKIEAICDFQLALQSEGVCLEPGQAIMLINKMHYLSTKSTIFALNNFTIRLTKLLSENPSHVSSIIDSMTVETAEVLIADHGEFFNKMMEQIGSKF